jgi:hypothetical protein
MRAFARFFAAAVLGDGKKQDGRLFLFTLISAAFVRFPAVAFRSSDNLPPRLTFRNEKRRCAPGRVEVFRRKRRIQKVRTPMEILKVIHYNLIKKAKIMLYGFIKIFIRSEMRWYALKRCIDLSGIAAQLL